MNSIGCVVLGGGILGLASLAYGAPFSSELQSPVRVLADGKPIDVEVGHAAPLVTDFDGDKQVDLLVGQFGGGKLRIYRNTGTSLEPKFGQFVWFKAGGADAKVPTG